jgi:translation initiation factor 2B subunit (eIF-2B alpha/beta/delta family)
MRRRAAALARDRRSGATALARLAARLLRARARDHGKSLARWQRELRQAGHAIAAAQPAMGSILTVVDIAFRAAECAVTPRAGARSVQRALDRYLRDQPRALVRAMARLPDLLPGRATCLTLSSSAGVLGALVAAWRRGRLAAVIVAESRPGCEGVATARRLAAQGIPVQLVVDALAPAAVREVDAVVVGADAVTAAAVWNKCGTLALALAARALRRPFLVVTVEDRLLPVPLARRLRLADAEPTAVLRRPPHGVAVVNRLFEATPLDLTSRVVTERGVRTSSAVRRRLAGGKASAWWAAGPRRGRGGTPARR